MIKFIIFLADLEKRLKGTKAKETEVIEADFEQLQKEIEPYKKMGKDLLLEREQGSLLEILKML